MTAKEREEQILSLAPVVRGIARDFNVTPATRAELLSAGWVGAIEAVDRFDGSRGIPLKLAAKHRIRGSMLDHMRGVDPLTRHQRQNVKKGRANEIVTVSLDRAIFQRFTEGDRIEDVNALRPHRAAEAVLDFEKLADKARIRALHKWVLKRTAEGYLMQDVAASMGISPGRVSQICSRTMQKLRDTYLKAA